MPQDHDESYQQLLREIIATIDSFESESGLEGSYPENLLYWRIGKIILSSSYPLEGDPLSRLAKDLHPRASKSSQYSLDHLKNIILIAKAYDNEDLIKTFLVQLSWRHQVIIAKSVKEPNQRQWYLEEASRNSWTQIKLSKQIKTDLFSRQGTATTTFDRTLPPEKAEIANNFFKQSYVFDDIRLPEPYQESELEEALVNKLEEVLREIGPEYAFYARQYRIQRGTTCFKLDLLLFHIELDCFVIIELKKGDFEIGFPGQLSTYISALDEEIKSKVKRKLNPTIGIIMCRAMNQTKVEYALRGLNVPMAVSTYQIYEGDEIPPEIEESFISARKLEKGLDEIYKAIEESL